MQYNKNVIYKEIYEYKLQNNIKKMSIWKQFFEAVLAKLQNFKIFVKKWFLLFSENI